MDEIHAAALEKRGLDAGVAAKLGWRPSRGPTDDLWIAIPYLDNGARVGTKYRTISGEKKQFTQEAGTPQILWNVDCLRDPSLAGYPVVVTEGEVDALAAIQAGNPRTVSVPGGAPDRDEGDSPRWSYLEHAKQLLQDVRPIVLAVDSDRNGQVLQAGLARRLGKSRCQVLAYPTGKDLGDVLAASGSQAVRETLALATYVPVPGLFRLREIPEPPIKRSLDTMIPGLCPHYRVRRGDLTVITGPPGHGKSSFVANLVCNMAWHWRASSVIASMEQAVVPDLRRILRSYHARCLEMLMSDEQKEAADSWIDQRFIFALTPGSIEDMTLDWLLERFAVAIHRHGASICVIDPWNEVSVSDRPQDWTVEQHVSQSLRVIKQFARVNNVAMVIVAHPKKMNRDRNGKVPKPGLWDIADSASWANRCDAGIVVYRPDLLPGTLTEIEVQKSRDYYAIGTPGMVSLRWHPDSSRFFEADYG